MKIGIVCPYNMFQFSGGVQEIVINLEKQLTSWGHDVRIITPRPRAHYDKAPKNYILVGRSAKMNTPFDTMADLAFEADGDEIEEILEREQFDILHFHEPWVPLLSYQILSKAKCVKIATFHAKLPESYLTKSIMGTVIPYTKSILKYIDVFTAVSEAAAEYVRTLTNAPIAIVPNGIDLTRFTPAKKQQRFDKKTIVFIGRLEKRKGVEYLVKAFERLRQKHDDVQLYIGGNGVKKASLKRLVLFHSIPDVHFLGYIPEEDKVELLQKADVFCSPAPYGESFGIVLLEAMAVGTPVVAGNNSGYASVLTETGILSLVTPKSCDDFATRLELMLYDDKIRKVWIQWAKKAVAQYDYPLVAKQYEAVYKDAYKNYEP